MALRTLVLVIGDWGKSHRQRSNCGLLVQINAECYGSPEERGFHIQSISEITLNGAQLNLALQTEEGVKTAHF